MVKLLKSPVHAAILPIVSSLVSDDTPLPVPLLLVPPHIEIHHTAPKIMQAFYHKTKGGYFIDRSGQLFTHIMKYLETPAVYKPPADDEMRSKLQLEAGVYRLDKLSGLLKKRRVQYITISGTKEEFDQLLEDYTVDGTWKPVSHVVMCHLMFFYNIYIETLPLAESYHIANACLNFFLYVYYRVWQSHLITRMVTR